MEANYDNPLFRIEIMVFQNGQTMETFAINGNPHPSYQAIIGALDIMKLNAVFAQSGVNAEKYRQWNAKQMKKKTSKSKT